MGCPVCCSLLRSILSLSPTSQNKYTLCPPPAFGDCISLLLSAICVFFQAQQEIGKPSGSEKPMAALPLLLLGLAMEWALGVAQLVPAVVIFGDSTVDVGNNNGLKTFIKSNFPPYGRDFDTHRPTGRFCNGRLATDYVCEALGFTSFPPAYLSPEASGSALLTGVNLASGGSGVDDQTAALYNTISLTQQLQNFKQYESKLQRIAGANRTASITSQALYVISSGPSDFIQNYYISPVLMRTYTPAQYSGVLVQKLAAFLRSLYGLGARRIGVTSLPPLGCLPASITLFGKSSNGTTNACVDRLNADASLYNTKLRNMVSALLKTLSGLKIVVFDIYSPLLDLALHPQQNGFAESRKACCGTGVIETAILCNSQSVGTCPNASSYVFWDSVHPSQAANQFLSNSLVSQGIDLIF